MSESLKVIKSIEVTDAILTATSVAEADYPVWSSVTTYALGDRVILTSTHRVYESAEARNLNNDPLTSVKWVEVSPTNRWKAFDLSSTTQTQIGASDYYELTPARAVNALAMVNLSGVLSIRVRLTDPIFGVVYDKTADLTSVPSEATWYAWFFEPRTEQTQFVVSDLPSYPNAVLRLDLTSSGAAYIGALVIGSMRAIGKGVSQGAGLGIQDYSRKETNDFGDTVLVRRAFAKRASVNLLVDNTDLDNTYELLSDLRATPCLWIASGAYRSAVIFGFYNSFEINISYTNHSDCSLDIEGLT